MPRRQPKSDRHTPAGTRRPAGIQAMDPKLYEMIQQAVRALASHRV